MSQYPKDEFDFAAEERGPKGAHRRVDSGPSRFLPFVLVLILGPLLAWGIVSVLSRDGDEGAVVSPSPTETSQASDPTDDGTATSTPPIGETDASAAEPTEDSVPENVIFDAGVSVLNGSSVQGLALTVAETLTNANFTDVYAGNYLSSQPTVSYVYFQREDLRASAQHIADLLGIEPIDVLPEASNEIVVVIRGDFPN